MAALTAMPNTSSATASLSKLSPCRTPIVRRGRSNSRSTAEAAAASGGDTIAPSAIAGKKISHTPAPGRSRIGLRRPSQSLKSPATATAAAVNSTSTTANDTRGNQLRSISRGGMSKAASITAGATNSAKASCGWMWIWGANGSPATQPPTNANRAG